MRHNRGALAAGIVLASLWWPSAVGAQGDDPSGTYSGTLVVTTTPAPVPADYDTGPGPGAGDEYVPPPPQDGTVELRCDGGTCAIIPSVPLAVGGAEVPVSGGTGTYEFPQEDFGGNDECSASSSPPTTVTITLDGDSLTVIVDDPEYFVSGTTSTGTCAAWADGRTSTFTGTLVAAAADPTDEAPSEEAAAGPGTGAAAPDASDEADPLPRSGAELATPEGQELTERQLESIAAVERGDRSLVPASVPTPAEAARGADRTVVNVVLAGLAVLLLVFPSQLFNSTWSAHHDRVERWFTRFRPARTTTAGDPSAPSDPSAQPPVPEAPADLAPVRRSEAPLYVATVVVGAVLAGFLDPNFGLDAPSATLVTGALLSIAVGSLIAGFAAIRYRRARKLPAETILDAVPSGLVVALVCVLLSRAVGFRPGYLFGLVGGLAFLAAVDEKEEGRAELTATVVGLAVALAAWLAFVPVSGWANEPDPSVLVQLADALVAALFIGGIEGLLFGLVPLHFLPGHALYRWSRPVWAIATFVVVFVFLQVLLRPETGYLGASSTASAVVTYGLFVGFGVLSVAFWGYFRMRPNPPGEGDQTVPPAAPPEPATSGGSTAR